MSQTSSAPTERPDTSIARQGYDHRRPTSQGLKDRRITGIASRTTPPTSTGLSDLMMTVSSGHSPVGLCWYRIGLSDLTWPDSNLKILSPLVSQLRWLSVAPTERPDTSVARSNAKGDDHDRPLFQGMKDLRMNRTASRSIPPPSNGLSDLLLCRIQNVARWATLVSCSSYRATFPTIT
jgi:hypothetical protein